ncbi:hypothetical protein [Novosphingobium mathurense]|uniref:Restriction endonuclease n=1 Tax=Novosphingobium mathurense TaxID=428990 RepID=A0A1U6IHJ6_9SPHN|nr:hypothetical protein [Novosphingobium mathurense]SLK07491.1 hypothetical protein SAMN06295987_106263 [Novosphingobium mathurense]
MNHLEQLTAEWLEYRGYFVRQSVLVGRREKGGYEGELDIVGINPTTRHLIHVECSLDADSWSERERRFSAKFERGRQYVPSLFSGLDLPTELDQVGLFLMAGGARSEVGGGRVVRVADFICEVTSHLKNFRPEKSAVPSGLPLLRTLQLATHFGASQPGASQLVPSASALEAAL